MKKYILSFGLVVLCAVVCMAQTAKKTAKPTATETKAKLTPEQRANTTVAKINAACKLNKEQIIKLESAYIEYYKKNDALKKQKDILSKDVYDQRKNDLKKTRNAVMKATLTAGQYKQWSAAKDKEKAAQKKESDEE